MPHGGVAEPPRGSVAYDSPRRGSDPVRVLMGIFGGPCAIGQRVRREFSCQRHEGPAPRRCVAAVRRLHCIEAICRVSYIGRNRDRLRAPTCPGPAARQRSRSSRDGGIEPEIKARNRRRMLRGGGCKPRRGLLGGGCKPRGGPPFVEISIAVRRSEIGLKTALGGGGRSAARGHSRRHFSDGLLDSRLPQAPPLAPRAP